MPKFPPILLLFGVLLFQTNVYAFSDTIYLNPEKESYSLVNARLFEDTATRYDKNSVLDPELDSLFRFVEAKDLTNYNLKSSYWLRFSLSNTDPGYNRWLMELVDPHIGFLELFERTPQGLKLLGTAGFEKKFGDKNYYHKNFVYEVDFDSASVKEYFVHFRSRTQNSFMVMIRKSDFLLGYALREYYLLGLFYGVLLVMALYNLFLFFTIRENTYLYYVLYVISCAFVSFSEDGLGFQFVWPGAPAFNYFVILWTPFFFLIFFILYSGSFLRLNERYPVWSKAIWGVTGIYALTFFVQIIFSSHPVVYLPIYLVPFAMVYLAGIYSVFKGRKAARYFVIAYSFILVSIVITFLRTKGLTNVGFLQVYSFNFGFFFEVIILSYAMSERFKEEKLRREAAQREIIRQLQEREKYQEKVNRELESRVQERTYELAEANKEIRRINEFLNNHNIELQKDVKQIALERITQQEISFEDFRKTYPDEKSCYDYLEELKWKDGYKCRKCGYDRFSTISQHSRRCTKCKYIESVTAYTIFHSIKFSILHAFYMLFLINLRKDIKVEELASVVPLSEKSCGSFKRKVLTAEKSLKGKSKGWERLIFFYEE